MKPWIARRSLQQSISTHLREEVMLNLNLLMGSMNALNHVNSQTFGFVPADVAHVGLLLIDQINSDRFDMYFAEQKLLIYEQTGDRELIRFYRLIAAIRSIVKDNRWVSLRPAIHEAIEMATKYFKKRRVEVVREQTPVDLFFGLDLDGNKITPA